MRHYIFEEKMTYEPLFVWDKLTWFLGESNDTTGTAPGTNGTTGTTGTTPDTDGNNNTPQPSRDTSNDPIKFNRPHNSVVNGIPTDAEGKYDFSSYYPDLKNMDKKNMATHGSIAINPEKPENNALLYGIDNAYDGRDKIFSK